MNKPLLTLFTCVAAGTLISFKTLDFNVGFHKAPINSGGSPVGRTGAPGESNCTSCHSGTAQNGATENVLVLLDGENPVTAYTPGNTYNVTLAMASNPAKKGFQATALNPQNTMAGSFSSAPSTNISTGNSKQYANHRSTSNSSSTALWSWSWTAPSTDVGNVTFYVASNKANNNGNDNGDVIYLSQHVFNAVSTASINEAETTKTKVWFNTAERLLNLKVSTHKPEKVHLNLVDITGKSVFSRDMGWTDIGNNHLSIHLPENLPKGIYVAHIFVHNTPLSRKIRVD
jgi:hypothetical protein